MGIYLLCCLYTSPCSSLPVRLDDKTVRQGFSARRDAVERRWNGMKESVCVNKTGLKSLIPFCVFDIPAFEDNFSFLFWLLKSDGKEAAGLKAQEALIRFMAINRLLIVSVPGIS